MKNYQEVELEVVRFEAEDVITTSQTDIEEEERPTMK